MDLKNMDLQELMDQLNNLDAEDLKKIGSAPKPVKIFVLILLAIVIMAAGGWFVVKPEFKKLDKFKKQEITLRQEFDAVQGKAANLEAYKQQLAEMRKSFGALLRQLPDNIDIESLLIDLSQTSVAAGMEVKNFKPSKEEPKEFYSEYPIELSVVGKYHEFGKFVSGLAALPRIVTLQDIDIKPVGPTDPGRLAMDLKAVTYRYLEEGAGEDK